MSEASGKSFKVCRCNSPPSPDRPFHVTIVEPGQKTISEHVTAGELLSWRRFKAAILQQTGTLLTHEADAGGKAGRLAWNREIAEAYSGKSEAK